MAADDLATWHRQVIRSHGTDLFSQNIPVSASEELTLVAN